MSNSPRIRLTVDRRQALYDAVADEVMKLRVSAKMDADGAHTWSAGRIDDELYELVKKINKRVFKAVGLSYEEV